MTSKRIIDTLYFYSASNELRTRTGGLWRSHQGNRVSVHMKIRQPIHRTHFLADSLSKNVLDSFQELKTVIRELSASYEKESSV